MKILDIFLERPRVLFLTLSFILLAGVSSALSLPVQENPELAQRWGSVTTSFPGASPERIETQVLEQLELKLREVTEIDELDSIIVQGFSTTVVEFDQSLDPLLIEQTWSQVQDKVDQVKPLIPEDANLNLIRSSGPPITVMYAIQWEGDGDTPYVMISRIADQLRTQLNTLKNTEKLKVFGGTDEEIIIEVDSSKLSSLGLTFTDLSKIIKGLDSKKPIGVISNDQSEYLFKLKDGLNSISKISEIPIKVFNQNELVRLGDIANVSKRPVTPVEEIMLIDGKRTAMVAISGTMSQRVNEYVSGADKIVDKLNKELPDEIFIKKIYDESSYTAAKFSELYTSFSLAIFFVLSFSLFFLGLRSAIVVTAILPFSVSLVLFGCNLIGLPLHMTSMSGIIIALGLLIDNGIIVVEDYKHRRSLGLSPNAAIKVSVNHLVAPLAAATATTVFAFLPIVTGEGSSIEFVGGLAKTVIMSIVSSLILALIAVPVMMTYLEKVKFLNRGDISKEGYHNENIVSNYRQFLSWAYQRPRRAISLALLFPVIGFISFGSIPKDFFPPQDRDMFEVIIELPQGTSAEKTLEKAIDVRNQIIESNLIPLKRDIWFIGSRLPRVLMNVVGGDSKEGNNNTAEAVLYAEDFYQMMKNLPELSRKLSADNPDIKILVDNFFSGPPVFADIEYKIIGNDREILGILGEQLELIVSNAPNIILTKNELSDFVTNLEFEIDTSNVYFSGSDPNIITNELYSVSNGINVGTMLDGSKEIPIRITGISSNQAIDEARFLTIPSEDSIEYIDNFGESKIVRKSGVIARFQSQKLNQVQGWVETGTLPSETETYLKEPIEEFISSLPKGFYIEQSGQAESRNQSQGQIYSSALFYLVLIIGGLVFALNSFRQTMLILSVGGLCIGLSYLGLTIGNQNYGFIATIGAVGLVGLSINDSIIVLSHIKEEASKKLISKAEIIEVVIRSTRHIITTSITTIGGFAPLIFTSVFFRPLAWAMTIGVLGATLLALLYIPAMFIVMNKIKN